MTLLKLQSGMFLPMVAPAKPVYVQRPIVVRMMSLRVGFAAHFARHLPDEPGLQRATESPLGPNLLRISVSPFGLSQELG